MTDRPHIPADIVRTVKIEAGFRCAVCGDTAPLELAHIRPWHLVKEHTADNLICLCASCHGLADRHHWGEKTLRAMKERPFILRRTDMAAAISLHRDTADDGAFRVAAYLDALTSQLNFMLAGAGMVLRPDAAGTIVLSVVPFASGIPAPRDPFDLVSADRRCCFLVADSGAGKSTFLRQYALNLCAAAAAVRPEEGPTAGAIPLPIYLDLAQYESGVEHLIREQTAALTAVSLALPNHDISAFRITLLCDDFQACTGKADFITQVQQLLGRTSNIDCIVASHDINPLDAVPVSGIPRFSLAPPDDDQLLTVFGAFLDKDRAHALYDDLAVRGELDMIRTPLLASLIAKAASLQGDSGGRAAPFVSRGELYRLVLRDGLLTQWQGRRFDDLTSPFAEAGMGFLSALAFSMVRRGELSIRLPEAEAVCAQYASGRGEGIGFDPLCQHLESSGLIVRSEDHIAFKHRAVRDYFAAEIIRRSMFRNAFRWFSSRWHGSLVIAAGLFDPDSRNDRDLRLLVSISLLAMKPLRIGAFPYATRLLYFLLEFVTEYRGEAANARRRIFEIFRDGIVFLSWTPEVRYAPIGSHLEDRYAHVYRLLGRLGSPDARQWLRLPDPERRRYKIHGVAQDRTRTGLRLLIESIGSDDDQIADDSAIALVFQYAATDVKEELSAFAAARPHMLAQVLGRMSRELNVGAWSDPNAQAARERSVRRIRDVISSDPWWRSFLFDKFVNADEPVSEAALSMLRNLGDSSLLDPESERLLVAALSDKAVDVTARTRAAYALVYGRSTESVAALEDALANDEDIRVSTAAADRLNILKHSNGADYFLTLLERWCVLDVDSMRVAQARIDTTVRSWRERNGGDREAHFRTFLSAAEFGIIPFFRLIAAEGLGHLRGPEVIEALTRLSAADQADVVREKAALRLLWDPDTPLRNLVTRFAADENAEIRRLTAAAVVHRSDEADESVIQALVRLGSNDPRDDIRRAARITLKIVQERTPRPVAKPPPTDDLRSTNDPS